LIKKSVHFLHTLKLQNARAFLKTVIKKTPDDPAFHFNLGLTYYLNKEFIEGFKTLTEVLSKAQDDHVNPILINLSLCLLEMKEYEKVLFYSD
jgi:tetratricopeptide (TPR) repeat protein